MREFLTQEFELSHGKAPKGRGSWAFVPLRVEHLRDPLARQFAAEKWAGRLGEPIFLSDAGFMGAMTYGEAKKKIGAAYPEITAWSVAP